MHNTLVNLSDKTDGFECGQIWATDEDVLIVGSTDGQFGHYMFVSLLTGESSLSSGDTPSRSMDLTGLRRLTKGTVTLGAP